MDLEENKHMNEIMNDNCLNYSSLTNRGYEKVRRQMPWNQYLLDYAYKLRREYKRTIII